MPPPGLLDHIPALEGRSIRRPTSRLAQRPHRSSHWSHDPNEATAWKTGVIMGAVEGGDQGRFVILEEGVSNGEVRGVSLTPPTLPLCQCAVHVTVTVVFWSRTEENAPFFSASVCEVTEFPVAMTPLAATKAPIVIKPPPTAGV